MVARPEPDVYQTAALINGLPTVTFVSRPYTRVVRSVYMVAGVFSAGTIYRAMPGSLGGKIASIPSANPNIYNVPFLLSAGQALYVVFDSAASPVNVASARISTSREW